MSTATAYALPSAMSSVNHCSSTFMASGGGHSQHGTRPTMVDTPSPIHAEGSSPSRCDYEIEPKSQLQNSSTMDSGVEDCCEAAVRTTTPALVSSPQPLSPPVPSIDLDDKVGRRFNVKMLKVDGCGYGFSVVWVSPPRWEKEIKIAFYLSS
jgi:hypothetical protein